MIGECAWGSRRGRSFEDATPVLNLRRTGERFIGRKNAEGIRGTIKTGSLMLPTIERGDNYRHLPRGWYDCICDYWVHTATSSNGTSVIMRIKAIRVLGDYSKGSHSKPRILIHPANWPDQLEGCIAAGSERSILGVSRARDAILDIFDAIGGWEQDKKIRLYVEN